MFDTGNQSATKQNKNISKTKRDNACHYCCWASDPTVTSRPVNKSIGAWVFIFFKLDNNWTLCFMRQRIRRQANHTPLQTLTLTAYFLIILSNTTLKPHVCKATIHIWCWIIHRDMLSCKQIQSNEHFLELELYVARLFRIHSYGWINALCFFLLSARYKLCVLCVVYAACNESTSRKRRTPAPARILFHINWLNALNFRLVCSRLSWTTDLFHFSFLSIFVPFENKNWFK